MDEASRAHWTASFTAQDDLISTSATCGLANPLCFDVVQSFVSHIHCTGFEVRPRLRPCQRAGAGEEFILTVDKSVKR